MARTFGESAGSIYDVAVNANAVIHAGESAPPYSGGPSAVPTSILTVTAGGTGGGTIESYPGGVVCITADSTDCVVPFPTGEIIYLKDEFTPGSSFSGYSGACSGSTCTVNLNANQSVAAVFGGGGVDAITPSINLGSVGGCAGGAITGLVYVTAAPGVTWTWPPNTGAGDPNLSFSPTTGTGRGIVTVTDTRSPQPPPAGSSCSNTQAIPETSYITIGFSDGGSAQVTINYTFIYVAF